MPAILGPQEESPAGGSRFPTVGAGDTYSSTAHSGGWVGGASEDHSCPLATEPREEFRTQQGCVVCALYPM